MNSKGRIVPVRLAESLLPRLDRRALLDSTTRSEVIRSALEAYLESAGAADFALSDTDRARIAAIAEKYGVATLELFGSQARGDVGSGSDIDLLYSLKSGVRLGWAIEDLSAELAEVCGCRVDLVAKRALHPRLRDSVIAEARLVYAA